MKIGRPEAVVALPSVGMSGCGMPNAALWVAGFNVRDVLRQDALTLTSRTGLQTPEPHTCADKQHAVWGVTCGLPTATPASCVVILHTLVLVEFASQVLLSLLRFP